MNSQSIGNCSGTAGAAATPCTNPCPQRFIQCTSPDVDLHPAPCPAILACGDVSNLTITTNNAGATTPALPVQIAEVEIDTTCLCFPNLKIEFSTLIDGTVNGKVNIQLSRTCTNGTSKVLNTYVLDLGAGPATTFPFSFVFCAENVPSKDCIYSVNLVSVTAPGNNKTLIFSSTSISALAVGCQRLC